MEDLSMEFIKSKGLMDEYKAFVKSKQSNMKNLKYDLDVMIGDADFWLDMSFVITKDDEAFLKAWTDTLRENGHIFSTGYEDHEKEWTGLKLKRLFHRTRGYLEGDSFCSGTSYSIKPTNDEPGDEEECIYEQLCDYVNDNSEDFEDDATLMELYKKTSFYEELK